MTRYEFPNHHDDDGSIQSLAPWLIVNGIEFPPVPVYAPRSWWQWLRRVPRRQTGWVAGPFTSTAGGQVTLVAADMGPGFRVRFMAPVAGTAVRVEVRPAPVTRHAARCPIG